ncbi:MAG: 4Fe-4S dicluster domain-containing protein [Thermodesulfobacteriota bacterium]
MQYGIYIDINRCMGCFACLVACKDWHDIPAGPAAWIRVKTIERGRYPDLSLTFLPLLCNHCLHPACASVCPAEAIGKRPQDGIVTVDQEACLGRDQCGLCQEACPYDAPQFGAEENPRMQKCDLCLERLEGGEQPICVISCPLEAIRVGPLGELRANYGDIREVEGFHYSDEVAPSILFKPKVGPVALSPLRITITPRKETKG